MSATDSKRLFFALWPDESLRSELIRVRDQLGWDRGKPVAPEKMHITLLFLGEVPVDKVADLKVLAEKTAVVPCELSFDRLEHWVRPAVLCLTAETVPQSLSELIESLKRGVRKLGFKPEKRPFRPHLTLARKVRKRRVSREIEPIRWPVRDFVLVASELSAEGARYRVIGRWPALAQ